jgi:hypothetical protein
MRGDIATEGERRRQNKWEGEGRSEKTEITSKKARSETTKRE